MVDAPEIRYDQIAQELGITAGAARVKVHRLRQQYQALLIEEVTQTCDPSVRDQEIRALFDAFD
jgi:DNA-directed RNA polymerase specialized sigma24 family protein